ncbi:tetratricopeptide repeat protein [Ramlibacter sp. WS9]|uniref:tetratricopeptide repeat protein n=1 Tax=Ramlibacter sp. WS9 TaxID=1882741 RepID=UPI00114412D1|nr:sel1 repeat family protein [Ramlibacter sp. WS9]ROZ64852.1 sel1 repeat family protein [Ramlibacter sp. WS9]
MRRDDIFLRDAARRGDTQACLEMATRLFGGKAGFSQNFKLGLAYLQQELIRESPCAIVLVGEMVPLELLIAQDARATLAAAARLGCEAAMLKLGVWHALRSECAEARQWLERSGHFPDTETAGVEDAKTFAKTLDSRIPRELLDTREVMLAGARQALRLADVQGARYCLKGYAALTAPPVLDAATAEIVLSFVHLASNSGSESNANCALDLPVELVESSLSFRSEHADVQAQYVLGCALAGMAYGCLLPHALVAQKNLRRATALLLRAADAGQPEAWHRLYEVAADCRSVAGNQEAARFFLEKAAHAGVVQAQRKLGAFLLKEATSLEKAERGVHWLTRAAERGDRPARELLQTLVLPLPALPAAIESSIVEKVRAMDAELAARLTLARAFHLTRREALNFNARRDIRAWGLLIPGTYTENPKGRLVPALQESMKTELQRAASFFDAERTLGSAASQKAKVQRQVFEALAIPEERFFAAEIGRSWSHYGFGRHWAARAGPLLKEMLGEC